MTKELTPLQKTALKLAVEFLEDLGDKYGNAGCNDYEFPNTDENWEIYKKSIYDNGDLEEIEQFEKTPRPTKKKILCLDFAISDTVKRIIQDMLKDSQ